MKSTFLVILSFLISSLAIADQGISICNNLQSRGYSSTVLLCMKKTANFWFDSNAVAVCNALVDRAYSASAIECIDATRAKKYADSEIATCMTFVEKGYDTTAIDCLKMIGTSIAPQIPE